MSAAFQTIDLTGTAERMKSGPELLRNLRPAGGWSPQSFARAQIRGLVRQVFFSNAARPVRQVVFSAVDSEADIRSMCRQVGEALAADSPGSIAVAGWLPLGSQDAETYPAAMTEHAAKDENSPLRQAGTRVRSNLWLVPAAGVCGDAVTTALLRSHLWELRREFEHSIVVGPAAGVSNDATAMAQLADGVILVLSAHHTRRATARQIKATLEGAQARILGTVLSDRVFPIPEGIYRRL